MLKQCPECSATMNAKASNCESCGRIFAAGRVPLDLKVFMGALAMSAIFIVAVAFLRSFAG
jgi:hypothetical protein